MSDTIVTHSSLTFAKKAGVKYYFTGRPCKNGHIFKRYSSDGSCVKCANMRAKSRYADKTELILEQSRGRYAKDSEKIKKRVTERRIKHPEKVRAEKKAEYERHKQSYIDRAAVWTEHNVEKSRECSRNWVSNNPVMAHINTINRRMRLAQRSPKWLLVQDKKDIFALYEESAKLTKETGIRHNVDHVIPLYGEFVSGLHVPSNLQILTARENVIKSNKFIIE